MRNGNSDFIIENIDKGLVDIGFVLEPVNLEKLNFLKMHKVERYGILTKKNSFLAQKEYIMPEDLKGISLINTARSETQNELKKWMGSGYDQLHFAAVIRINNDGIYFSFK